MIKSRRMRWAGYVAHMGGMGYIYIYQQNIKETDHLGNLDVDGRIILKLILKRWDRSVWTLFMWLRIGTRGGLL
jgi:hypothetical protein